MIGKRCAWIPVLLAFLLAPLSAEDSDKERLIRLSNHLKAIQREARTGRVISGSTLLGAGVLGGATFIGAGLASEPEGMYGYESILYMIGGSLFIGLGLPGGLILAFPSDMETMPRDFLSMPERDDEDRSLKVEAGETILSSLADKGRRRRIYGGAAGLGLGLYSLAMAGALDSLVPGLSDSLSPYPSGSYDDYYYSAYEKRNALYQGLVFSGSGLLLLLIPSRPERELEAYNQRFTKPKRLFPWLSIREAGPGLGLGLAL